MKALFLSFLFFNFAFAGCSTSAKQISSKNLDLAQIECLEIGKTQASELRKSFGNPDRVVPLTAQEDIWIYLDHQTTEPVQKASFVINRKNGLLLTATWIPGEADPIHRQAVALVHFKTASFVVKDVGLIANHHYSDEVTYNDSQGGISLRVNPVSQTISAVSFGPKLSQPVAKQP